MEQYLPILSMIVLVMLFASLSFVASILLGPKRPTTAKDGAVRVRASCPSSSPSSASR